MTTQRVVHPRPLKRSRSAVSAEDTRRTARHTAAYAFLAGSLAVALAQITRPALAAVGHPDSRFAFWLEVLVALVACLVAGIMGDRVLARTARRSRR